MQLNKGSIIIILVSLIIGIGIGTLFLGGSSDHVHLEGHTGEGHELVQNEEGLWTCSMHPQVRQSEPGSCPFCGMALIPVDNRNDNNPRVFSISNEAAKLANIKTSVVGNASTESNIVLNGKIKKDERLVNIQTSHFGGRVEKLYKNFEGDIVRKGDPIASIYSPELVSAQEELIEAKKLEKSNPVLLEAARKKLEYWKLSENQIEEIEASQKAKRNFDLLADYDGTVTKKLINNGDHIMQGEGLLEVTDLSRLWAIFEVYEKDLDKISLGQLLSFDTPYGETIETRVSFIDTEVDSESRIVELRGNIRNNSGTLKPEMFIKANLALDSNEVLTVPKSAVLWTGKRSIVYVKVDDEPSFELREVELGRTLENAYEIKEGVEMGEEVVTNGAFTLDAEAQLQGKISMMNNAGVKIQNGANQNPEIEFQEIVLPEPKDYLNSTSSLFKSQLVIFFLDYIKLKDLMVEGDGNNIQETAKLVESSLEKVDMALVKGDAHMFWMELLKSMQTSIEKIVGSSNRDAQRLEFINLSKALIVSVQSFGLNYENPLYVQFCPMANNDQGAPWISLQEEIINPYFGDAMLNCGYILESIQ